MRGRIFLLSPTGEYIAGHVYQYRPGRFTPVGDGRIVVTGPQARFHAMVPQIVVYRVRVRER